MDLKKLIRVCDSVKTKIFEGLKMESNPYVMDFWYADGSDTWKVLAKARSASFEKELASGKDYTVEGEIKKGHWYFEFEGPEEYVNLLKGILGESTGTITEQFRNYGKKILYEYPVKLKELKEAVKATESTTKRDKDLPVLGEDAIPNFYSLVKQSSKGSNPDRPSYSVDYNENGILEMTANDGIDNQNESAFVSIDPTGKVVSSGAYGEAFFIDIPAKGDVLTPEQIVKLAKQFKTAI